MENVNVYFYPLVRLTVYPILWVCGCVYVFVLGVCFCGFVCIFVCPRLSVGVCVQYFYNAQTQQYLYWDTATKAYIPVPGYTTDTQPPAANASVPVAAAAAAPATVAAPAIVAAPATVAAPAPVAMAVAAPLETQTAELDGKKATEAGLEKKEEDEAAPRLEKKEKEKEEKPRSLAAFKVETWHPFH